MWRTITEAYEKHGLMGVLVMLTGAGLFAVHRITCQRYDALSDRVRANEQSCAVHDALIKKMSGQVDYLYEKEVERNGDKRR